MSIKTINIKQFRKDKEYESKKDKHIVIIERSTVL